MLIDSYGTKRKPSVINKKFDRLKLYFFVESWNFILLNNLKHLKFFSSNTVSDIVL